MVQLYATCDRMSGEWISQPAMRFRALLWLEIYLKHHPDMTGRAVLKEHSKVEAEDAVEAKERSKFVELDPAGDLPNDAIEDLFAQLGGM